MQAIALLPCWIRMQSSTGMADIISVVIREPGVSEVAAGMQMRVTCSSGRVRLDIYADGGWLLLSGEWTQGVWFSPPKPSDMFTRGGE